jgi:hypothetical protein
VSKKKKGPFTCLACGKERMRRSQPKCNRCGKPNPGYVPKVAAPVAFIAKGAGGGKVRPLRVVKSAPPVCHCGNTGKRGDRFCHRCALPYGISAVGAEGVALKAAGIVPGGYWGAQAERENDSGQREQMRSMAVKGGRQPDAEAIARAWGFADLRSAAMFCDSPEARSYFQQQFFNPGGVA